MKPSRPLVSICGIVFLVPVVLLGTNSVVGGPIQWRVEDGGNGHYYEFVGTAIPWDDARIAAYGMTFMGTSGYLATITSSDENAFVNATYNTGADSSFAWLGGWEPNDDGVWRWADGPEAGVQFSSIKDATPPFNYANWGGEEPNDGKPHEDYAMINIGSTFAGIFPGQWADASPDPSGRDPVIGYIVEYTPEPATITLVGLGGLAVIRRTRR